MNKLLLAAGLVTAVAGFGCSGPTRASGTHVTSAQVASRPMHGVYRSDNGVTTFQECGKSEAVPVAQLGAEYEFLDTKSRQIKKAPSDEVVTYVAGHMERRGAGSVLVIDRVDRLATGKGIGCAAQP